MRRQGRTRHHLNPRSLVERGRGGEAFLLNHSPLPATLRLEDAPCWSVAQAALLREELRADADWAELVDQLNAALR
ncbi:DUF2789 family protein [Mitsuaria sp. WAJ17]|nr:DUF2789 family protein [Mitsuaria sp. WAJ17]